MRQPFQLCDRRARRVEVATKIGGGKDWVTGRIDIAMFQSLYDNGEVRNMVRDDGQVIVDECHHISAFSYERVVKEVNAKYVLGLTATLARKNGQHPIVLMQCGPVRYRASAASQARARPFDHVYIPRQTVFGLPESSEDMPIQVLYDQLLSDEARNNLIFDDLLMALEHGRSPLLLTGRVSHLEYFANRLKGFAKNIVVLRGGMGKRQLEAVRQQIDSVPPPAERVIIAMDRFIGEGFDDAPLDTLFLVFPISWRGTLQQYVGRLHRLHEGKREFQIYDYVASQIPVFERMYQRRRRGYGGMGYEERVP